MAPLARWRYEWGTVASSIVWTDAPPQHRVERDPVTGEWRGGYEMRSWAIDPELAHSYDDVVGDALEFPDADQAARFFTEAAQASCHSHGTIVRMSQPSGARDLAWLNPDRVREYDVYLLRGSLVYRLAEVPPASRSLSIEERAATARIDRLACGLPKAGCKDARGQI
jgi:hypothetical protein